MLLTYSKRAKDDVDAIWAYTERRWGLAQAEVYMRLIEEAANTIVVDPKIGRSFHIAGRQLRKYLFGSHVLIYRLTADRVFVVRILHRRMDAGRHLQ
jgi:toxin ParE1/3/4